MTCWPTQIGLFFLNKTWLLIRFQHDTWMITLTLKAIICSVMFFFFLLFLIYIIIQRSDLWTWCWTIIKASLVTSYNTFFFIYYFSHSIFLCFFFHTILFWKKLVSFFSWLECYFNDWALLFSGLGYTTVLWFTFECFNSIFHNHGRH